MASAQSEEMCWMKRPAKTEEKVKAAGFDDQISAFMAPSDETVGGQILHCEDTANANSLEAAQESDE